MNREEILRRFPNAGPGFIAANLSFDSAGAAAVVECAVGPEPLAESKAKKADRSRFLVRVVSVRKRLLDEDNLAAKYHVDLLRYAGILPSDAPECCQIQTTQKKASKGEAEHTEINVYELR